MNETTMTVAGNLVSDVSFQVTARGDALARFRIASTVKRYDRASGSWLDGDTAYWNVTAWRRAAENARDSLAKGHPVVVHGRVRQRSVDRAVPDAPGVVIPVTYTDLEAVHFGLDLTRCRASFQRAPIGPQTGASGGLDAPRPPSARMAEQAFEPATRPHGAGVNSFDEAAQVQAGAGEVQAA